jgi:hypothetical protein
MWTFFEIATLVATPFEEDSLLQQVQDCWFENLSILWKLRFYGFWLRKFAKFDGDRSAQNLSCFQRCFQSRQGLTVASEIHVPEIRPESPGQFFFSVAPPVAQSFKQVRSPVTSFEALT